MKLKAILIDDEAHGLASLQSMLETGEKERVEIIGMTTDPIEGVRLVNELKPDILFLDIRMPKMDGFQLLGELKHRTFFLVFTTAYSEYGLRAIEASASEYLMKPVDPDKLNLTITKVSEVVKLWKGAKQQEIPKEILALIMRNLHLEQQNAYPQELILPSRSGGLKPYRVDTIMYIKGDGNYSHLHFKEEKEVVASKTLKKFETLLDPDVFVRAHRSCLLALAYVSEIVKSDQYYVRLVNGVEIPVARRRVSLVRAKVNNFKQGGNK